MFQYKNNLFRYGIKKRRPEQCPIFFIWTLYGCDSFILRHPFPGSDHFNQGTPSLFQYHSACQCSNTGEYAYREFIKNWLYNQKKAQKQNKTNKLRNKQKNNSNMCMFYSVLVLNAQLLSPYCSHPDSKVHGTNMGPTWILSAPVGPHVGPMNLAIKADMLIVLIISAP